MNTQRHREVCFAAGSNGRDRGGFTLIELLVVIAIIAILAAILFPVFANRREVNTILTFDRFHELNLEIYQFSLLDEDGDDDIFVPQLPPPISTTSEFWNDVVGDDNFDFVFSPDGTRLLAHGYQYEYLLAGDNYELLANPVAPGLTGDVSFYTTGVLNPPSPPDIDDIEAYPTPNAAENRELVIEAIQADAREYIVHLLINEASSKPGAVLPYLCNDANLAAAFNDLSGGDGLSLDDLANAPVPEEFLDSYLAALQLGAGGEETWADFDVTLEDLQTDPCELFTWDDLCALVEASVQNEGIHNSLCQKIDAAKAADLRGNTKARNNTLSALQSQVAALAGKKIDLNVAKKLTVLAEVLKGH